MKLVIAVCTIFVLTYINSSEAACSDKSWVPVPNIEMKRGLGRWFSVLRFANGNSDNSDCLWHDVVADPTVANVLHDAVHRTFKSGTTHTRKAIDGDVRFSNPGNKEGKMHVEYKKGSTSDEVIVALDYDEFALVRACYGNAGEAEEYFWAYSRNQYPSNATYAHIFEAIDKQGIDRSKLVKSCSDVKASEIV